MLKNIGFVPVSWPAAALVIQSNATWSDEEEALIAEFQAILATTPRNALVVETTKRLLFPTDTPEANTVKLGIGEDESELAETPRSILSTTSRQEVNMIEPRSSRIKDMTLMESRSSQIKDMVMSSSTPRIFTSSLKPTSFSDILPPQSIHPPKLVGAKTFEDLLKRPKLINNIDDPSSNTKLEIEKRKKLIKEALERIKKNRIKLERKKKNMFPNTVNIITEGEGSINMQPVLPELPKTSGDREEERLEFVNVENKFKNSEADDEKDTWQMDSPTERPSWEGNSFQNILEEHTEKTFGIDIMDVPGRMQSTLLRLLKKSKGKDDQPKDPLLRELNPRPTNYAGDLSLPNNMKGLNINYEIDLSIPENMDGLQRDISGLRFPDRVVIPKDEKVSNLEPPNKKQDPLLKSLSPKTNPKVKGLAVPDKELSDHLEDLKESSLPNDIILDTITIEISENEQEPAKKFERIRVTQNPRDPLDKELREFPGSDDYEDVGGAPEEHQNPLLRLVENRSMFDANILSVPKYRQDPLLRQLRRHPEQFRNDFLELPARKQDTLLSILRKGGDSDFDIDRLVPPDYKQNPLLRLLRPGQDDVNGLTAPNLKQDPLLKQLRRRPENFKEDFLQLPRRKQDTLLKVLRANGMPPFDIDKLKPPNYKQNPLLRLLRPSNQGPEGQGLSPPNLRQDPLLLQLRESPQSFQDDFLQLPHQKQDALLKVLRTNGVSRFDVNKLTPPGYKQNPLLRILDHNNLDTLERDNLSPPPLVKKVMENPENFKDDFAELPTDSKVELLEMIDVFDTGEFKIDRLIPNKSERLRIAPKHSRDPLAKKLPASPQPDSFEALLNAGANAGNPLLHFIEAMEDKDGELGAKYEKDPLLRQLRLNPESYQDDFLELPRRRQDTLLKLLRGDIGLEARLVERLVPPGQRQDPLLRALIAGDVSQVEGLNAPERHGNPLLRLLRPTGRDAKTRDRLSPPNLRQDPLLKQLRRNPSNFRDDFLELPKDDQKDLVEMIKEVDGENFPFKELIPERSGRLQLLPNNHPRDPLSKALPDSAQKDRFAGASPTSLQNLLFNGEGENDGNVLDPPRYKQNPLLRQLLTEPQVYREAFLDLPKKEQDTLLKILKKEGGDTFDANLLIPPNEGKGKALDDEALQLLSFYNWAELILQRMDQNLFWEEIKVVLGTIIQEKLGEGLGNPNKFSELLETSEPETSFKKKVEAMMEKLKTMDESGNRPSADKIDQLMENLVKSAKEESKSPGEMEAKVAMVDNLVNLFIQGNAVRAQKTQSSLKKQPIVNTTERTKKIIEKIKKELSGTKPKGIRIKPSRDSKRILIEKAKNRPNNHRERTNGLRPPIRLHRPKTVQEDFLEAPREKEYDVTIGSRERKPEKEKEDPKGKKLAPLIVDRNPLLRLLTPDGQDERDKDGLTPPAYRQDPLLRQLLRQPAKYKDEFLQLPSRKQDTLLGLLEKEGGRGFDSSILSPPEQRQNPLLRLLRPSGREKDERELLSPPQLRQDPLLRQLMATPEDYREDFLSLPTRSQEQLEDLLEDSSPGLMPRLLPLVVDRNPLLRLLEPDFRDEKEKESFSPPDYRQDPLLRQLASSPQDYRADFLSLPRREQKAVEQKLKEEGLPKMVMEELMTNSEDKMLTLKQLFDMESKEDMSEKIFDMLTSNTEEAADSFSELFEFSSEKDKEETVEEIIEMVDRDPTAVTSAFSDLIFEKVEQQKKLEESPSAPPPTDGTTTITMREPPTTNRITTQEAKTTIQLRPTSTTTTQQDETTTRYEPTKSDPGPTKQSFESTLPQTEEPRSSNRPRPESPSSTTLRDPGTTKATVLKSDQEFLSGPQRELERELGTKEAGIEFPESRLRPVANAEGEEELFTPKLPHPYKDPPAAVQGQLLRYSGAPTSNNRGSPKPGQTRTETKFQETPKTSQLDLKEDFDLPHSVLSNMQGLIEEGQLSREDVIEHLINNGFLPVEVTELGRLPITVGVPDIRGGGGEAAEMRKPLVRKANMRGEKEQASLERLRELANIRRVPFDERGSRIPFDDGRTRFEDVDISDPDFDFERVGPSTFDLNSFSGKKKTSRQEDIPLPEVTTMRTRRPTPTTAATAEDLKELEEVNEVMDMIKMFDEGRISEDQLLVMLGERGEAVVAGEENPVIQITESPRSNEITTEFAKFNMDLRPVKHSFTNMNMRGGRQEGDINMDDFSATKISFPGTGIEPVELPEVPQPPPVNNRPFKPFTAFDKTPVLVTPTPHSTVVHTKDSLFYHELQKVPHPEAPPGFHLPNPVEGGHSVAPIAPESHYGAPAEGEYGAREFPQFTDFHVDKGPGLQDLAHLQQDEPWNAPPSAISGADEYPGYLEQVPPAYPPPRPVGHEYHSQTHSYYTESKPYTYSPTQDYRGQPYSAPSLPYGARELPIPSGNPQPHSPVHDFTLSYSPHQAKHPEVKSLSEHPYGPYGERYANYHAELPPSPPSPEYWGTKEDPSPILFSVDSPTPPFQQFDPQSSAFYPRSGVQYGQRMREGRQVAFLPDHTTLKPFAYEPYPTIPRTGHGTLDHTIEDIHKAFIEGDAIGHHVVVKTSRQPER